MRQGDDTSSKGNLLVIHVERLIKGPLNQLRHGDTATV